MTLSRFLGRALAPACLTTLAACGGETTGSPTAADQAGTSSATVAASTGAQSTPSVILAAVAPAPQAGPAPVAAASATATPTATATTTTTTAAVSVATPASATAPVPVPTEASASAVAADAVSYTWTEDATKAYYNGALKLPWSTEAGAWRDRAGAAQGPLAFATLAFVDRPAEQTVRWDVTDLVRAHGADMLIKRTGGTNVRFHSREAGDAAKRPRLVVERGGASTRHEATADTWLSASTAKDLGESSTLSTAGQILVKFDVAADPRIDRAYLEMTATAEQYGNQTLDVFRADPRPKGLEPLSLALGGEADVVLRLNGEAWRSKASGFRSDRLKINGDGSLTIQIPAGDDMGSGSLYAIPAAARREVMFSRAVMKVHSDWKGTMGGKYPGLANTGQSEDRKVQCGWGGRLANGTCWSARTNRRGYKPGTPFADSHQALSPYAYRVDNSTPNGEGPAFVKPIRKGEYVVLDQMVKLNSIGPDGKPREDGEIAYWLNGELIGRMQNVIWRTNGGADTLPSEYWLNVYEGGVGYKAPHAHSISFHEVKVSTKLLPFDAAALARLNGKGA